MFLLTLVLLLHLLAEGSSQYVPNVPISEKEQSEYIVNLINEMRAKVANGDISTSYGPLPSSLHMFQLESNIDMIIDAKLNAFECVNFNYASVGASINFYSLYETPSDNLNNITVINLALASWMEVILNTNFDSQVTYTNQDLQEFANMMYYKSTKAGCAYQECNQPAPAVAVVACVFNSAPEIGKPIYPATAGVTGCNNDGDCSSVFNGTKCGPQGLCGYSFTTTTKVHSTASTAPVTTPATEKATSGVATGTTPKAATASTQRTGTSPEASSASTQGTEASSKAVSASTQGTGASSKAPSASTKGTTTPKAASTPIPEKTTAAATTLQTVLTTTAATKINQSELFMELINGYREKVAKGDLSTSSGSLPSSLQMFQVEYSPELEVYAQINTIQCQPENFTPSGSSMSYYTFYQTPGNYLNKTTVINLALACWMQEILYTNFGNQVTYTNQNIEDFANMIYYKSTKAGCAYQECNQIEPPRAVVACIFNSAPQLGKPIYPGTQGVNGCNTDSSCSAVFSGTTCGPQGLCGYSFS
ncbi:hypothetical protein V3C99_006251 [Haemonchus contortus]